MSSVLEIVGATIIGGFIILIIFNLNSTILESTTLQKYDKIAQGNITSLVEEIDYDLKKIGYRASDPAIITADTNAISFKYDLNNDGVEETVNYFLSDTTVLSNTPNPRDMLLYRTINGAGGQLQTSNLGVTGFRLWYYNSAGNLTTTPADIRSIKYELTVESVLPYDDEYAVTHVSRLIQPNNLR